MAARARRLNKLLAQAALVPHPGPRPTATMCVLYGDRQILTRASWSRRLRDLTTRTAVIPIIGYAIKYSMPACFVLPWRTVDGEAHWKHKDPNCQDLVIGGLNPAAALAPRPRPQHMCNALYGSWGI